MDAVSSSANNLVQILISAKDNASAVFARVGQTIGAVGGKTQQLSVVFRGLGTISVTSGKLILDVLSKISTTISSIINILRDPMVVNQFNMIVQKATESLAELAPLSVILKNTFSTVEDITSGLLEPIGLLTKDVGKAVQKIGLLKKLGETVYNLGVSKRDRREESEAQLKELRKQKDVILSLQKDLRQEAGVDSLLTASERLEKVKEELIKAYDDFDKATSSKDKLSFKNQIDKLTEEEDVLTTRKQALSSVTVGDDTRQKLSSFLGNDQNKQVLIRQADIAQSKINQLGSIKNQTPFIQEQIKALQDQKIALINAFKGSANLTSKEVVEVLKLFNADVGTQVDEISATFNKGIGSDFIDKIAEQLNKVDSLIMSTIEQIKGIPQIINTGFSTAINVGNLFGGVNESIELLGVLKTQFLTAFGFLSQVGEQLTFFASGLNTLKGLVQTGPFALLIQQNIQFQEQLLSIQASIAATNKVVTATGQELKAGNAIQGLSAPVRKAINDIRAGSLELVGVTSSALVETFQIITGQMGSLKLSLQDASDLTLDFAASLGTVGIPLYQQRQEIQSILTATIDMNSVLAKTINISNDQVKKWQAQGILVDKLREKLQAFREGNALASKSIGGISSNIQEVFEEVGRLAGEPLLEPLVNQLNIVYEALTEINEKGTRVVKKSIVDFAGQAAQKLFAAINKVIDQIFALFGATGASFTSFAKIILDTITTVIDSFGDAIKDILTFLRPFINILNTLFSVAGAAFEPLVAFTTRAKVLQFAIMGLGGAFTYVAKAIPVVSETMFLLGIRSNAIVNTWGNITGIIGKGGASFLLLGKYLQQIPGAVGLVSGKLGKLPPLIRNLVIGAIPAMSSFGISALAFTNQLGQNWPIVNKFMEKFKSINVAEAFGTAGIGVQSFGGMIEKQFGSNRITGWLKDFGKTLTENNDSLKLTDVLAKHLDNTFVGLGGIIRKKILLFGGLTAGLLIAANIFDQFVLQNEKLLEVLGDLKLGFELILGVLVQIGTNLVVGLINPLQLATDIMEGFKILLDSLTDPANALQTTALGLSIAFLLVIRNTKLLEVGLESLKTLFKGTGAPLIDLNAILLSLKTTFQNLGAGIASSFQSALAAITSGLLGTISSILKIKDLIGSVLTGITSNIVNVSQYIYGEIVLLFAGLKSVALDIGKGITFAFKAAFAGSLPEVQFALATIINNLKIIPSAIATTFMGITGTIFAPIVTGWTNVVSTLQAGWQNITYIFQNFGMVTKLVATNIGDVLTGIKDGLGSALTTLGSSIKGLWLQIKGLWATVSSVINMTINGIRLIIIEGLTKLATSIKSVLAPVMSSFLLKAGVALSEIGTKMGVFLQITEQLGVGTGLKMMGEGLQLMGASMTTAAGKAVGLQMALKGLMITLGSIALLAAAAAGAFLAVSNVVNIYKKEVKEAQMASDRQVAEVQNSAKEQLDIVERLREAQKKKASEYINLTDEEIAANAKAEKEAKMRVVRLETANEEMAQRLKGSGKFLDDLFNKPRGEYAEKLQAQIEENKKLIEQINQATGELQIRQTDIEVKGTAFQQLAKDAKSAREEIEKAFKSGEGTNDNLNAQATKFLETTKQQLEQGAISAEQARKNIELLLQLNDKNKLNGLEALSAEVQIKAREQLIGTIKSEADLKASLANTELERVQILIKAQQESVDKQMELLRLMDEAAVKSLEGEKIALAKQKAEQEAKVKELEGQTGVDKAAINKNMAITKNANIIREINKSEGWIPGGITEEEFQNRSKAIVELYKLGAITKEQVASGKYDLNKIIEDSNTGFEGILEDNTKSKSELGAAQKQLAQTTADLETAEKNFDENVKKSKEQTAEAEKTLDLKNQIEMRKLRKDEIQARLADLGTEQEKALSILKNSQNARMIVAKKAFQLDKDQLLLDQETIKSAKETTTKQLSQAQTRLKDLQAMRAEEAKRAKPDPTTLKDLDKQIRETQNNIQELTISAIDNEIQATEKANQILLRALNRRLTQERTTLIREEREGLKRSYEIAELNAKKDLEELQEKKKLGKLSKDEELALEQQIEQAKTKVFEAELATRKAKLEEQNQLILNQITAQNQQLEKQGLIIDGINKLMENQVKLAQTRQSLQSQYDSLIQTEIGIIAEGERTEFRKKRLAELGAALRLEALKRQQKFELESFALEQRKQQLLLEREEIQNRINKGQAEADLAKAKADAEMVAIDPKSTEAQKQSAQLQIQAAQAKINALTQESGFIQQQKGILQETSAMDLQRIQVQQKEQLLKAQSDLIGSITSPGLKQQLRNKMGDELAQELGANDRSDLMISGNRFSRQITSNEFGVNAYRPISDLDPSLEDIMATGTPEQQRRARQQAELNYLQQTGGTVPNGVTQVVPEGKQLQIATLDGVNQPSPLEQSLELKRIALELESGLAIKNQPVSLGESLPRTTLPSTIEGFNQGVTGLIKVLSENTKGLQNLAIALTSNKKQTTTASNVNVSVTGNNFDQIINRALQLSR